MWSLSAKTSADQYVAQVAGKQSKHAAVAPKQQSYLLLSFNHWQMKPPVKYSSMSNAHYSDRKLNGFWTKICHVKAAFKDSVQKLLQGSSFIQWVNISNDPNSS